MTRGPGQRSAVWFGLSTHLGCTHGCPPGDRQSRGRGPFQVNELEIEEMLGCRYGEGVDLALMEPTGHDFITGDRAKRPAVAHRMSMTGA